MRVKDRIVKSIHDVVVMIVPMPIFFLSSFSKTFKTYCVRKTTINLFALNTTNNRRSLGHLTTDCFRSFLLCHNRSHRIRDVNITQLTLSTAGKTSECVELKYGFEEVSFLICHLDKRGLKIILILSLFGSFGRVGVLNRGHNIWMPLHLWISQLLNRVHIQ